MTNPIGAINVRPDGQSLNLVSHNREVERLAQAARDKRFADRASKESESLANRIGKTIAATPGILAGVSVGFAASEETLRKIHDSALRDRRYSAMTDQVVRAFDNAVQSVGGSRVVQGVLSLLIDSLNQWAASLRARDFVRDALRRLKPAAEVAAEGYRAFRVAVQFSIDAIQIVVIEMTAAVVGLAESFLDMLRSAVDLALDLGVLSRAQRVGITAFLDSLGVDGVAGELQRRADKIPIFLEARAIDYLEALERGRKAFVDVFRERADIPRQEAAAAGFLDRVGAWITTWLNGRHMTGVVASIDSAIMSSVASFEASFASLSASLRSVADSAAGIVANAAPVLRASASLADAFATLGANADRMAASAGAGAFVARARLALLGAFAIVRSVAEAVKAAAAFASLDAPRGILHSIAAAGFATAAALAFAGGSGAVARPAPVEVRDSRGALLGNIGAPRRRGNLLIVATSSVTTTDRQWVDDNILGSIRTGAPLGQARVVTVDERREKRRAKIDADAIIAALRQRASERFDLNDPLVQAELGLLTAPAGRGIAAGAQSAAFAASGFGLAFAATPFGAAFLAGSAVVGGGEVRRIGRRIGREAKRVRRRLGF